MKKFKNFPVINSKSVSSTIALMVLCVAFISAFTITLSKSFDHYFVGFMVNSTLRMPDSFPKGNIARTVLSMSFPTVSFTPQKAPALPASKSVPDVREASLPKPAPENAAQSITYVSAEEKGYKSVEGIYINNQTSKIVNVPELLNSPLDLSTSDEPLVLIIHTHTTESYTPSQKYNYTPTETDRTTDPNFNMVSVGKVIYDHLTANGINVIHDTTLNDHPSYSKSYSNSLALVNSYIEEYPSIKIVIDVHRDAIITKDGAKMRPVTEFDPSAAQVMLVIGTNDSGLNHPAWQTNLAFALKLQHKMNTLYPSLARPINLRRERFNQHTVPYAFILEVGTNGNTLDEAKAGALLFSKSFTEILNN